MNAALKAVLLKTQAFRDLLDGRRLREQRNAGMSPIFVDYPVRPVPRYGHGKSAHPELLHILGRNRSQYQQTLTTFLPFKKHLARLPVHKPEDPRLPFWLNRFFQGLDPVSLYAFGAIRNPVTYVEIGSGNSTKFMRRAIDDHGLRTRIISIDPHPRAEIDRLCEEVRRQPLEDTDLTIFEELGEGDILLMDGSHRAFMNSDVTVFFLEVLPRLKRGVLVYIDDVYLPFDYPPEWIPRFYSEHYLLAVLLLADSVRYNIVLPCTFIGSEPSLMQVLDPLWRDGPLAEAGGPGNGFWLSVR